MRNDPLSVQSMDFAVSVINLVKALKAKHETVISNQIGRSGTSNRLLYVSGQPHRLVLVFAGPEQLKMVS